MGKIEVTIEALQSLATKHDEVRDELSSANRDSLLLTQIQPPMEDQATASFVTAACQAGQTHLDSVITIEQELRTWATELRATIDQYHKTDEANDRALGMK